MALLALLVSIPLIALISLSIFGGGQIFMPIFNWLWESFNQWFSTNISRESIDAVFAVSNSTPGILSPKFAALTGYLVAGGEWWGYVAMILTYLAFVLPAILMMQLAIKYVDKFEHSPYLKRLIQIMNPVVTGIIIALSIQLFIATIAPNIYFNKSISEYVGWKNLTDQKLQFFSNWRRYVLYVYVPVGVGLNLSLYMKKSPMFALIIANVIVSLILFQPWLN
ncbi:chromate transport protein [Mycoplasmopsis californica HAZ160_1]|uniref:Chromate ion transporter n=2 Tax=Mycoplasmopsis californica TaxID=2113 RepID=A0A059XRR0_9BACT|nr:chromate transporter [Mycoplasmopsis californica]AIA29715.1 chromate ion transporter [Mycoplasmopsis californica]BAP00810.1 chromate transport protein [Mycoplasmopsis californica HAZ160_1]BBG40665.1 chromate transport protein [Mycoplasmopsis californica]BBG41260.1 chromate transport protein [Mycoplasmopsis californica]BBG41853.1 chromate transport protein [Mycoplasmopsis californica]